MCRLSTTEAQHCPCVSPSGTSSKPQNDLVHGFDGERYRQTQHQKRARKQDDQERSLRKLSDHAQKLRQRTLTLASMNCGVHDSLKSSQRVGRSWKANCL
jgi:hypothetical protein